MSGSSVEGEEHQQRRKGFIGQGRQQRRKLHHKAGNIDEVNNNE
jgi:hypothetical protein